MEQGGGNEAMFVDMFIAGLLDEREYEDAKSV
jgi:hypothetical protein